MKILLLDQGQPFNLDTNNHEPLGGSEYSLLLLAKGLSELNHQIVILNNRPNSCGKLEQSNIIFDDIKLVEHYASISDIIILNRINPAYFFQYNKFIFYYNHDAYDQPHCQWMLDSNITNNPLLTIMCVSEWQAKTLKDYMNIEKTVILNNSLDSILYQGYTERDENKLVFAGIPYKGLEILNQLFNDICIQSKNDKLELHIYSSMKLYGKHNDNKEYEKYFSELQRNKNVYIHEPVNSITMAKILLSSSIYLSPNLYHETFGMLLVQAQAAGCLPVCTNNGACLETVFDSKFITKGKNILNAKTYQEFIDIIINTLNKESTELYSDRLKAQNFTKKFNYINIANNLNLLISRMT